MMLCLCVFGKKSAHFPPQSVSVYLHFSCSCTSIRTFYFFGVIRIIKQDFFSYLGEKGGVGLVSACADISDRALPGDKEFVH